MLRTFEFWIWELLPRNDEAAYNNTPTQNKQSPRQYRNTLHLELLGLKSGHPEAGEPPWTWSWTTSTSKTGRTASRTEAHRFRAVRLSSYKGEDPSSLTLIESLKRSCLSVNVTSLNSRSIRQSTLMEQQCRDAFGVPVI